MSPLININKRLGEAVKWLTLALVFITVADVALRYFFKSGSVAVQELEWHIFSAIFLLAAGYTFAVDGHVRVDISYAKFSPIKKAIIKPAISNTKGPIHISQVAGEKGGLYSTNSP